MTDLFNPEPRLTQTQSGLLAALDVAPVWRVRDGWRRQGVARRIRLDTAAPLIRAGWAAVVILKGKSALVITPEGRAVLRTKEKRA